MITSNLILPVLGLGLYANSSKVNLSSNTAMLIGFATLLYQQSEINKLKEQTTSNATAINTTTSAYVPVTTINGCTSSVAPVYSIQPVNTCTQTANTCTGYVQPVTTYPVQYTNNCAYTQPVTTYPAQYTNTCGCTVNTCDPCIQPVATPYTTATSNSCCCQSCGLL